MSATNHPLLRLEDFMDLPPFLDIAATNFVAIQPPPRPNARTNPILRRTDRFKRQPYNPGTWRLRRQS